MEENLNDGEEYVDLEVEIVNGKKFDNLGIANEEDEKLPTEADVEKSFKETREIMAVLGRFISGVLEQHHSKPIGFMLTVFEFGKPSVANYISNVNREDMIESLKETVELLSKKKDYPENQKES